MPHNAINDRYVIPMQTHVIMSPTWSPGSLNHTYGWEVQNYVGRIEPESTNNPKRPDGTRAPSNYHIKSVVITNSQVTVETAAPGGGWFCHNSGPAPLLARFGPSPSTEDLINWFVEPVGVKVDAESRTKFLKKLNDAKSSNQVELGVAAGEFREAVGMMRDLANLLVSSPRNIADKIDRAPELVINWLQKAERMGVENALRHTAKKDRGSLEFVVNAWLTYQMGLRPMYEDAIALTAFVQAAVVDSPLDYFTCTVRAGAEEEYRYVKRLVDEGLNGSPVNVDAEIWQLVKIHLSGVYKIPIKSSVATRLGLDNSMSVLWNLARYSWLVDSVLDVGGWLSTLTASRDTVFLEGSRSRRRTCRIERLKTVPPPGIVVIKDPARSKLQVSIELFDREVLGHGVMPAAFPTAKESLNLVQLANALSVLKNFVGR